MEARRFSGNTSLLAGHGANPGLVSYFLKLALEHAASAEGIELLPRDSARAGWSQLSKQLDLRAVHVAELDTQDVHGELPSTDLLSTWSVSGFLEECNETCCYAWGVGLSGSTDLANGPVSTGRDLRTSFRTCLSLQRELSYPFGDER